MVSRFFMSAPGATPTVAEEAREVRELVRDFTEEAGRAESPLSFDLVRDALRERADEVVAALDRVGEDAARRQRPVDVERATRPVGVGGEGLRLEQHGGDRDAAGGERHQGERPRLVGRRRHDDHGGVPPEAARLLQEQRGERGVADGARHRQGLEDAGVVVLTAVGLLHGERLTEGDEADGAVGAQEVARDRGADGDGDLLRGVVALPDVHPLLEVEHDPDVGARIELELLHHQLARAGGRRPVDAVVGIAGRILAHAGDGRGHVVRALAEAALAREVRGRDVEVGELRGARVDEHGVPAAEATREAEEAERVHRGDGDGTELVDAAPSRRRRVLPALHLARAERQHATGEVAGDRAGILDLEPDLRPEGQRPQREATGQGLPLRHALGAARDVDVERLAHRAGPEVEQREGDRDHVGDAEEQPETGGESDEEGGGGDEDGGAGREQPDLEAAGVAPRGHRPRLRRARARRGRRPVPATPR